MRPIRPLADLPTHGVANTPPHLGDQDLSANDVPLHDWIAIQRADVHSESLAAAGQRFGAESLFDWAEQANGFVAELKAFDRYGKRVKQVSYHPAWHELMVFAVGTECSIRLASRSRCPHRQCSIPKLIVL